MRKKWVNANCFLSWRWLLAVSPIFLANRAVQNKCNFQERELKFLAVKHSTAVFSSSLKQLMWMPKKEPVCSCGLNTSASQFSKKRLEDLLWVSVTILYWAAMGTSLISSLDAPVSTKSPLLLHKAGVLSPPHCPGVPSGGSYWFICIPHHTRAGLLCSICLK